MTMRVLILAHAYAPLMAGGGERAALSLHHWLVETAEVDSVLVARAEPADIGHSAPFAAFRGNPRELVANLPIQDQFSFETDNFALLERMIGELLARVRPDVVHVEHFQHWSLDILPLFARAGVPVVVTLHEFLLICHNHGQMVKTDGRLCHAASPAECARCFPQHSAGDFFLRRAMIDERLASVAAFIAPSRFLAQRFVDWGLAPDRIHVIDNPLSPALVAQAARPGEARPRRSERRSDRLAIGFFGQANPYKGVMTLLEAVELLPDDIADRVTVGLHCANLHYQGDAFRTRFEAALAALDGVVRLHPPYANDDVLALMRGYDWIVVPSVWWENSPLVIQEAALAGRPVLASAIGGMAEKVAETGGATFRAGDPRDLAERIAEIVEGTLTPGPVSGDAGEHRARVAAHLALYRRALADAAPEPAAAARRAAR
jgi:glycosyltransferase involved in cell wall biosynthesis